MNVRIPNKLVKRINGHNKWSSMARKRKVFFSFNERYIKKTFLKVKKSTYQEFFNLVDFTKSHVLIIFTCVYS